MSNYVPKYRIYDKQDDELYEVTSITWQGGNIRTVAANGRTYEFTDDGENWPVMQATGMKDANGTEIYADDLFKAPFDHGFFFDYEIGRAHFDEERGHQWEYWDTANIEIVGNIYQNPELVDKQR